MNFKGLLMLGAGRLCSAPFALPLVRRSASRSINVAYYHYAGSPSPHYQAFYSGCTVARLISDFECLSRVFEFVSLDDAIAGGPTPTGKPGLAITFDDGLDLTREGAIDVLNRYGIKASTFVIKACVDNQHLMWRHALSVIQHQVKESVWRSAYLTLAQECALPLPRGTTSLMAASRDWNMDRKDAWTARLWELCRLPPVAEYLSNVRPYMTWQQLHDWIAAGHSVGFHTLTHPFSDRLGEHDLEAEFLQPAIDLRERLHIPNLCMSYPFGSRLNPALEKRLYETGVFKAFFGIRGFVDIGSQHYALERYGLEDAPVGWVVHSQHIRRLAGGRNLPLSPL